jgi:hypothetical protein
MTDDLVKRLRSWQGNLCNRGTPKYECWEAADALERLSQRQELVAWASPNVIPLRGGRDNHHAILTPFKCAANTVPLYAAPPATQQAEPVLGDSCASMTAQPTNAQAQAQDGRLLGGQAEPKIKTLLQQAQESHEQQAEPVAINDSRCSYMMMAGHICNKCGRIHDGVPNAAPPDDDEAVRLLEDAWRALDGNEADDLVGRIYAYLARRKK